MEKSKYKVGDVIKLNDFYWSINKVRHFKKGGFKYYCVNQYGTGGMIWESFLVNN